MINAGLLAAGMMHAESISEYGPRTRINQNPGSLRDGAHDCLKYPTIQAGYESLIGDIEANKGVILTCYLKAHTEQRRIEFYEYLAVVCFVTGYEPHTII